MKNNLLIACLLLLSCKKDIPNPITDTPPASFSTVFDDFWNDMNADYLYWDIDTTDWTRVHTQYKPLFDKLNLADRTDQARSVAYFRQITDELIDHHYLLSFDSPLLADSTINPANDRLLKQPGFRYPYSYLASDGHYLDSGALRGSANQVSAIAGTIVDLNFLGGQFTGTPLHFGYTRYKSGNGRLDYTPWIDALYP